MQLSPAADHREETEQPVPFSAPVRTALLCLAPHPAAPKLFYSLVRPVSTKATQNVRKYNSKEQRFRTEKFSIF